MSKEDRNGSVGASLDFAELTLRRGGVVAFPTETYYGLAVDPFNPDAVGKVFKLKKRDSAKPLMLLIENESQLSNLVEDIPPLYEPLIRKFWPGALTLIFTAASTVSSRVTGDSGTVGIRISSHPLALELVARMGQPITATSANISGLPPAKSASEVEEMFGSSLDYILDGGKTPAGLCSTIVGIKERSLTLLRPGQVELAAGNYDINVMSENEISAGKRDHKSSDGLKWDKGYALKQAGDDAALVEELLDIFKESLRTDLQLMAKGLAAGSASMVYRSAHSIKGGAASLGIGTIADLALEVEQQSHAGELELAHEKLPVFWGLMEELEKM
ncbi:MAG: L-threonylcarbamoyladenylate synthase [Desulforhopalus sp.]